MSDEATATPTPGWYDDPSGAAPYRRWDGARWTQEILHELPAIPGPVSTDPGPMPSREPLPAAPAVTVAAADGSFPSRRSLRQATPADDAPPAAATNGQVAAAQAAPAQAWTSESQDSAPRTHFSPGTASPTPPPDEFVAPAAWVAHAPAAVPAPAAPPMMPYGARVPAPPVGYGPAWTPVSTDRNRPARWALTLTLLVIVISAVVNGFARASHLGSSGPGLLLLAAMGLVMIMAVVAAIPLAIVGLVRAHRIALGGQRPRGRAHAIVGLVLVVLIGLASGSSLRAGFEDGLHRGETSAAVQPSAAPTVPAAAPAQTPDAGTAQDQGGATTYVYSQALTQSIISQAIAAKTSITPNSVQCPASEPLTIGTTFDCNVALPSTGSVTVKVTVMSEQGQITIQALP